MADKRRQLLEGLAQKRKGAPPDLVHKVLKAFGYKKVRQVGSHQTYQRPGSLPIVFPYKRPHVGFVYVDQILKILQPLLDEGEA